MKKLVALATAGIAAAVGSVVVAIPADAGLKGSKQCNSSMSTGEVFYDDPTYSEGLDPGQCIIARRADFKMIVDGSKFRVAYDYGDYREWQYIGGDPYNGTKIFTPADKKVIYYDARA